MVIGGIGAVLLGLANVLGVMVALRPPLPGDEPRHLSGAWKMWSILPGTPAGGAVVAAP
ncbi:MAG: hypothetical protein ABIV25_13585 [Paracoccaceae bacterium]